MKYLATHAALKPAEGNLKVLWLHPENALALWTLGG
jgi:hypothetical protein